MVKYHMTIESNQQTHIPTLKPAELPGAQEPPKRETVDVELPKAGEVLVRIRCYRVFVTLTHSLFQVTIQKASSFYPWSPKAVAVSLKWLAKA